MNAFLPRDETVAWLIVAGWGSIVCLGWLITRLRYLNAARCCAWSLVIASFVGLERLSAAEPAGLRMTALIFGLLFALKAVVSVEVRASGQPSLSTLRWLGFTLLWVGMRPALFASAGGPPLAGGGHLVRRGLTSVAEGLAALILARLVWFHRPSWLSEEAALYLATAVFLVGLSLVLHFGILNVMSGLWRWAGVDCRPLFRTPLRSRSLREFWGRRWNLAFSEMTAVAVYRPLARHLGTGTATFVSFLFSGLVHEAAISVPVGAGYGLPMLYFALHGMLVQIERHWERQGFSLGRFAHAWTLGWLAVPLPLLFHPYFLSGVVWPLLGITALEPTHLR